MHVVDNSTYHFIVASDRTSDIPDHAIEIEGDLVQIGTTNKNGWGLAASGVDEFIAKSQGIPIRVCNDLDPHACDFANDNYSNVGYVTKTYVKDGWIKSKAAITKKEAVARIDDGTWTPFNKGDWSVSGVPAGGMDKNGLVDLLSPTSIALVLSGSPAYEGSGFAVVAAALHADIENQTTIIEKTQSDKQIGASMTDETTDADAKPPETETKPPAQTEPVLDTSAKSDEDSTMFDQEAVDAQIAAALEIQKAEYETQMSLMTPNAELDTMFAAAKTEAVTTTLDQIKREKLADDYIGLVTASKILSAPLMDGDKLDVDKIETKKSDILKLSASTIETMITEGKQMVAALPSQTQFDSALVKSTTPGTDFDYAAVDQEFKNKLGMT